MGIRKRKLMKERNEENRMNYMPTSKNIIKFLMEADIEIVEKIIQVKNIVLHFQNNEIL